MTEGKFFQDLVVWRQSMTLVEEVSRVTQAFPSEERYGLSSQLRRAAVSIPSNIAEGSQRRQRKVFVYFLRISLGSRAEVVVQLEIARRLGFLSSEAHQRLTEQADTIGKMLHGLIAAVERQY
mgnify:CR=1 FL=1